MPLAEDDDVIEQLRPDGANKSLGEAVLPGRSRRDPELLDAHAGEPLVEHGEDPIAIKDDALGDDIGRHRLDHLLGRPRGVRVRADVHVQHASALERRHEEGVEHAAFSTESRIDLSKNAGLFVAPPRTVGGGGIRDFLRTVARALTELGFVHGASVDDVVARALRNGAADEEDAAYCCLIGSEQNARRFVAFDHHLDPELVSAIDNALDGEQVRIQLESHVAGQSLTVRLSNATSETTRTVEVHSIAELVSEVDAELAETRSFDEPNTNRQAFWLVCNEGSAVLFATDAEVAALVNAGVAEGSRDR